MSENEEYELLPHSKLEQLRSELEQLKRGATTSDSPSGNSLVTAIEDLTRSVEKIYALFENIPQEVLDEYKRGEKPEDKLDKIIEQNRHIAEGIIALSENLNRETPGEALARDAGRPAPQSQTTQEKPVQQPQPTGTSLPGEPTTSQNTTMNTPESTQAGPEAQQQPPHSGGIEDIPPPRPEAPEPPVQGNAPQQPQSTTGESRGQPGENQNPFKQQMEIPPVKANYPSHKDYPGMPEQPTLTRPLHVEPDKKKKKFMGLF